MSEIIRILFINLDSVTNGAAGLSGIPQFINWGWLFVFTAGTIILLNNFIKSSYGRACISLREDEIAAESMGINSTKYKVIAFVTGAFLLELQGQFIRHTIIFWSQICLTSKNQSIYLLL